MMEVIVDVINDAVETPGGGIDCMVRNISDSGARVDIVNPTMLPQSFTLVIKADHFLRRCHPVWSRDLRIGLAF
jgi:hypothetical protein